MKLSTIRDLALQSARVNVAHAFAAGVDISQMLVALRGEEAVATVSVKASGPQIAELAIRAAATGFSADVLIWISDTYKATTLISPISGKPWQRGEMEAVAEFYEGREKGWVTDAITVVVVNRAGDTAAAFVPYTVLDGELVWTDDGDTLWDSSEPDTTISGVIQGILQSAMAEPTLSQAMDREVRELMAVDHETAMLAQDLASCKALFDLGHQPILTADEGSLRARKMEQVRQAGITGSLEILERLMDQLRSN